MQRAHFCLCALVGAAFSFACSGTDDAPTSDSGGNSSSRAGHPGASGGDASGGASLGNGGSPSAGDDAGASSNGGLGSAGGVNGGASNGGAVNGGSGGINGGVAGNVGSGSAGKGSAGSSAGSAGRGSGGASVGGGSGACPELNNQLCGMTALHNQARANVTPAPTTPLPNMAWDATVSAAAQTWADQCNFSHNTAGYGQNLYASAGSGPPTPTAVVSSWVSEVAAYNYSANSCSATCGHYTQVVWRSSTLVGCGAKACSTNSPFGAQFPNWYIVVCDYSPAGNNGSRPY